MESRQHRRLQLTLKLRTIKGRRRRRDLFWWQVCWLGGLLLALLCISSVLEKAGYFVVSYASEVDDKRIGRRLMEHDDGNATNAKTTSHQYKNCTEPVVSPSTSSVPVRFPPLERWLDVSLPGVATVPFKVGDGDREWWTRPGQSRRPTSHL